VLGAWLFISIFMWPHDHDGRTNTWMIGLLLSGFGALSLYLPWVRWVTGLMGAWLCVSTLAIDHVVRPTVWNNLAVGLLVLAASLVPYSSTRSGRRVQAGS
jgi:hypothetical protein